MVFSFFLFFFLDLAFLPFFSSSFISEKKSTYIEEKIIKRQPSYRKMRKPINIKKVLHELKKNERKSNNNDVKENRIEEFFFQEYLIKIAEFF